jgi:hypothetical protein
MQGKFGSGWSIVLCDRATVHPLEAANGYGFCRQMASDKTYMAFLEALQHRGGAMRKFCPATDFVDNLLIKLPRIGKRQMSQMPG